MSDEPTTRDRILAAAVAAASDHGIRRLSMSEVARRAGVSRPTLYKHFPSKDDLIAGAVARETERFVEQTVAVTASHDDPREALEVAIAVTLRLAREHPLLDRLIRTEPETLVPLLISDGGPTLPAIREVTEVILTDRLPGLDEPDRRRAADALTRLLVSYVVSAPTEPPEVVAATVARLIVEGVALPTT